MKVAVEKDGSGCELTDGDGVQELALSQPAVFVYQTALQKSDQHVTASIEHGADFQEEEAQRPQRGRRRSRPAGSHHGRQQDLRLCAQPLAQPGYRKDREDLSPSGTNRLGQPQPEHAGNAADQQCRDLVDLEQGGDQNATADDPQRPGLTSLVPQPPHREGNDRQDGGLDSEQPGCNLRKLSEPDVDPGQAGGSSRRQEE